MVDITSKQFKSDFDNLVSSILSVGDTYRIDTGKGKVVLMEEAEYKILLEALEICIALGTD